MTMMIPHPHMPLHPPVVPTTNLATFLALVTNMTPACHVFVTNMFSAKRPAPSNGLNVRCTTPPLVHREPQILTLCASTHNPPNIAHLLLHLPVVPICRHTAIVTLTPLIKLMIVAAPQNAVIPVAALAAILAALTIMMMINVVIDPLIHVLKTISSPIRVCQGASLKVQSNVWMARITHLSICKPFHPVHFDDHGDCQDHITATYSATYLDFESNESSCIGGKSSGNVPPLFDIHNYTDPKTKEYSY